jgi:hypothetical protein
LSDLAPTDAPEACASEPAPRPTLEEMPGRPTDLGGLAIRRLLPRSRRRLVGPWCFLDAFGPLAFSSGKPMDVAPHPHIGLQTVSWLLEGEVLHNDSLGGRGLAAPGVLNLMTAGRGVAHSEETPPRNGGRLWGVQLWVALPNASRETLPSFEQHRDLPVVELDGGRATVILGEMGGSRSPARAFSPIVGAEIVGSAETRLAVPLLPHFEHALLPLAGDCQIDGQTLSAETLYYLGCGRRELPLVSGPRPVRALLLGGAPFGETVLMWWNFVARTTEEIVAAREDWEAGRRFGEVTAYDGPRLPAPPFRARPVPRP